MASGVVGDIVAHQFDQDGQWLDIAANRRAISFMLIRCATFRGCHRGIGVALIRPARDSWPACAGATAPVW